MSLQDGTKKIKKAQTDPDALPSDVAGRAGADNLVSIYAALAELAVEKLAPISARMNELMGDPAALDKILAAGNGKANELAAPTVQGVRDLMGFWSVG